MLSANSEEHSKPVDKKKKQQPTTGGHKNLKIVLIATAALVGLALWFGPSLILNSVLNSIKSREGEFVRLDVKSAKAGFMFRSLTFEQANIGFKEMGKETAVLKADRLEFSDFSALKLFLWVWREGYREAAPLWLGDLRLQNVTASGSTGGFNIHGLSLGLLSVDDVVYAPDSTNKAAIPFKFASFELKNLNSEVGPETGKEHRLNLSSLEARNLTGSTLDALAIRGFDAEFAIVDKNEPPFKINFSLGGLNMGAVNSGALEYLLSEPSRRNPAGVFLALWQFCETLDIAQGLYQLKGHDVLTVKSIIFDVHENENGGRTYIRQADVALNLKISQEESNEEDEPFNGIMAVTDGLIPIKMDIELTYNAKTKIAELGKMMILGDGLGRLDLTGRLSKVSPLQPGQKLEFMMAGAAKWQLNNLEAAFNDLGMAVPLYQHLDRTTFKNSPKRQSGENIIDYYIKPIADQIENEGGLANLPAVQSEVEAFLKNPASIKLVAAPPKPVPIVPWGAVIGIAKFDKYDIIGKMNLKIQVNNRAPVSIAAAAGVIHERLPSSLKSQKQNFKEEDL